MSAELHAPPVDEQGVGVGAGICVGADVGGRGGGAAPGSSQHPVDGFKCSEGSSVKNNVQRQRGK